MTAAGSRARHSGDGPFVVRLGAVAALALLLRVAAVLWIPTQPVSDFWSFIHLAKGLVGEGRYEWGPGYPTAMFAPAYPLLLAGAFAVAGPSLALTKAISVLLSVALVVVGGLAARQLLGASAALAAAAILALDPRQILLSCLAASELLAAPALFCFVWLLARSWRRSRTRLLPLLAGLALGVSALSRPVGGLVWVLWPASAWLAGKRARIVLTETAMLVATLYAVLLPWGLRNLYVLDRFTVTTTSAGMNLFMGNNDTATGGWNERWREQLAALRPEAHDAAEGRLDAVAAEEGRRWIAAHPVRAARLYLAKLGTYLEAMGSGEVAYWAIFATQVQPPSPPVDSLPGPHPLKGRPELVGDVLRRFFAVVTALAALGAVRLVWIAWRGADPLWRSSAATLLGLVAYFPVMTSVFIVVDRYRWPVEDVLTLLAGFGVVSIGQRTAHPLGG